MRLKFNIALIDDDIENERKSRVIQILISELEKYVANKGFQPVIFKFTNMEQCLNDDSIDKIKHKNRVDLYLSDNNLTGENQNGIDLYLQLKNSRLICDFILYTKSEVDEIIKVITKYLRDTKDPNLFSRFTFVTQANNPEDNSWHDPIKKVLDHVINSREEISHLRGLFAHETAIIHNKMREILNEDDINFSSAIKKCYENKIISDELKEKLSDQRKIRNEIIHSIEDYNDSEREYYLKCKDGQNYSCKDFPKLRNDLAVVKDEFYKQIKNFPHLLLNDKN